jgi:hypothetical protein
MLILLVHDLVSAIRSNDLCEPPMQRLPRFVDGALLRHFAQDYKEPVGFASFADKPATISLNTCPRCS